MSYFKSKTVGLRHINQKFCFASCSKPNTQQVLTYHEQNMLAFLRLPLVYSFSSTMSISHNLMLNPNATHHSPLSEVILLSTYEQRPRSCCPRNVCLWISSAPLDQPLLPQRQLPSVCPSALSTVFLCSG